MHIEVDVQDGDISSWKVGNVPWGQVEAQIAQIGTWVTQAVKSALPDAPSRVGVDFGVKLTAETGKVLGVLAKASGEASLVIRLEWEPQRSGQ
ncbi:CU044_2847 family protein [Longispora sp. K20-0274]|uniref:CU044_2847 family protein n=1 Tax=Longispora sp. K20-0274 TaxID=3088255 RepID=UPI00399A8821